MFGWWIGLGDDVGWLIAHSPFAMARLAADGRIAQVNAALAEILGVKPDDLVGTSPAELVVREIEPGTGGSDMPPLAPGLRELTLQPAGADPVEVVVGEVALPGAADKLWQVRRGAEDPGAGYRLIAQNVNDVVAVGDNDGVLRWVSPSVTQMLGWRPGQLAGMVFRELVHPDDADQVARAQQRLSQSQAVHFEVRLRRADGGYRWMQIRVRPILDANGAVAGRVAGWWDAQAEHESHEALARSEARFRAALDAELDGHVFLEAVRDGRGEIVDFVYVDVNARAEAYLRRPARELLGARLLELFPGQRQAGLFAQYVQCVTTGEPLVLEDLSVQSEVQGKRRRFDFRGVRVGDGLSLSWRDVTETRSAAEALAESERRYRLLAENASDVVFQGTPQAVLAWVSPSVTEVTGRTPSELVGRPVDELVHPEDLAVLRGASVTLNVGERASYRARFAHADGSWRWAEVTARPVRDDSGAVVARVGSLRDVHEQVLAEQALARAEERYRTVAENSSDVVFRLGADFRVEWAFGATQELLGRTAEELVGCRLADLFLPADVADSAERQRAAMAGQTVTGLARVQDPTGQLRWVDRRTRAVFDDAGQVKWLITTLRDAQAQVSYREALERSEEQARMLALKYEAARNDALAANLAKTAFLSRMSHELRTPLNAVLGFAQLLAMDPLTTDQQEAVAQIRTGGKHLLELITEVLDIARIEAGRLSLSLEPVLVDEVLTEAVELVAPLAAARSITVSADPGPPGTAVMADRQRLIQILLNLLGNAIKYNVDGGWVRISACAGTEMAGTEIAGTEMAGPDVVIRVADSGPGITPDDQARLFRAFERLDATSSGTEGTGIGLALSLGLAQAMSGDIQVSSESGRGAVFALTLPKAVAGAGHAETGDAPAARRVPVAVAGRAPLRVLYVEDNPANARLVHRIAGLRDHVLLKVAGTGALGLEAARRDRPDLVLLDLHLPDLPGDLVLRELRAEPALADIPIVVVSADASVSARALASELGADGFLAKPIEIAEVLAWLDDPAAARKGGR